MNIKQAAEERYPQNFFPLTDKDAAENMFQELRREGFIEGANCSEKEWISVEDGLPKESCNVLVYTDHEGTGTMWFSEKHKWHTLKEQATVTHWMPLPSPPAGEKAKSLEDQEGLWEEAAALIYGLTNFKLHSWVMEELKSKFIIQRIKV